MSWALSMMKPGNDADGIARTEANHHMKCPACGRWFDIRDSARCSNIFTTASKHRPTLLFVAGFAGTRVSEQIQRYVDLLQQAFDFLALVWTQIFVHPVH